MLSFLFIALISKSGSTPNLGSLVMGLFVWPGVVGGAGFYLLVRNEPGLGSDIEAENSSASSALPSPDIAIVVGIAAIIAVLIPAKKPHKKLFPQNQHCQSKEQAIKFLLPDEFAKWRFKNSTQRVLEVTNCKRLGMLFFLSDQTLTRLNYTVSPGKFYAVNGDVENDLIVHIGGVQPASSLLDSTLKTNDALLSYTKRLVKIGERFNGTRLPSMEKTLDRFEPYKRQPRNISFYISKKNTVPEMVVWCKRPRKLRQTCTALVYYSQDRLAFNLIFPARELKQISKIAKAAITKLRQWRVD